MAWSIERQEDGTYRYSAASSAWGAVVGDAATLAEAKVRLAIGEAALYEAPYPPAVREAMLADPERFAADWPDPEIKEGARG